MTEKIPLGEKENLHREFKSRDALKKPESIAREVVAMLNADGGTVWVGLRDENDRAVAVESVPNADREQRRLRDYLVDTIEPSPAGNEVEVEVVPVEGEGEILRVRSKPGSGRGPYAHLKDGSGRWFLTRVGERNRPMTREEVFRRPESAESTLERAIRSAWDELRQIQERTRSGYWLLFLPSDSVELDLEKIFDGNILIDPVLTQNRRTGLNFAAVQPRRKPERRTGCLEVGSAGSNLWRIFRSGKILFEAPLRSFHAGVERGALNPLWPDALLEYPVSTFRLASKLFEDHRTRLVVHLAILGLEGWSLRPGSPRSLGIIDFLHSEPAPFRGTDLILDQPLIFDRREIVEEPDRCGLRLIQRVYEAFGYGREAIPQEFDQKTGRLIFPE